MADAPKTSNDLCDSLRRIADTIETNGGWHIAAIKVRAGADEIERLRAIAEERDELVLEVARLQHALAFWLPQVPAADNAAAIRCGNDAMLLAGCECPLEPCAEELGWITMHTPETTPARPDAAAIAAVPGLAGKNAVVLYFETEQDREELVAAIHQAKPGMRAVKI